MHAAAILDLAHVRAYILAGAAIFTVVSKKSGERRTYRVREREGRAGAWFVDVLSGPENSSDYSYIGFLVDNRGELRLIPAKQVLPTNPSVRLFRWLASILNGAGAPAFQTKFDEQAEVWHSGTCARCGRLLTDPESIARGLGPTCATRS